MTPEFHVKIQKISKSGFREKLWTNEQTDKQTNGRRIFHRTSTSRVQYWTFQKVVLKTLPLLCGTSKGFMKTGAGRVNKNTIV